MTAILTTSAPVARIARARSARSAGTPSKSCDDSTMRRPPVVRDQIVEAGAPFDVDVLGAERQRLAEQPPALLLRSLEAARPPTPAGR